MNSLRELFRIGRGPSSSHTMGPAKAVGLILNRYGSQIERLDIILYASLAYTGKGHLTDAAITEVLKNIPHTIKFDKKTWKDHPNTLDIIVHTKKGKTFTHEAISLGGGAISLDGEKDENITIYPEKSFQEIKNFCLQQKVSLAEYVYYYEGPEIKVFLKQVYQQMEKTINKGLKTEGILPGGLKVTRKSSLIYHQKGQETSEEKRSRLLTSFSLAAMEENASGGMMVTSPTCGASGILPSVLRYARTVKKVSKEKIIDALAVGGVIGNLTKKNATISGAVGGCQAEVGTACAMAAAAYAYVLGLDIEAIECAAEIAFEHHLGLTCDPVAGLVQIPCIERNAVGSLRAIDAALLARHSYQHRKVSLDVVIKTMYKTGLDLNKRYKETSKGGLALHVQFHGE